VRALDADIVGLQEIDERRTGPDGIPAFIRLSEEVGWHSAEARTISTADGDYGNVLLSRWPIGDACCIDLSFRRREPRKAISGRVDSPAGPIRVLTAHLGLSDRERRHQIGLIARHVESVPEQAAIVLGDFNEWRGIGLATRALCPPFALAPAGPSFPSRWPVFRLDRIWCRSPLAPLGARTVRDCRDLSDHLPVLADLVFR
jgi:endonuclease/exonuclease/phosphatase family metal-dependent hydrolase